MEVDCTKFLLCVLAKSPERLNLDKHLRIKIGEKGLAQRFGVSVTSFSSDKNEIWMS